MCATMIVVHCHQRRRPRSIASLRFPLLLVVAVSTCLLLPSQVASFTINGGYFPRNVPIFSRRCQTRRRTFWMPAFATASDSSSPPTPPPSESIKVSTPSSSSSSSSSSSTTTSEDLPANLRRKVSAKRPLLGNVVPKASRIQAKQQRSTAGGSSQPELRLQGRVEGGNRKRMGQSSSSTIISSNAGSSSSSSSGPTSLLRIMGGSQKGRRLDSPQLVYLRPMMSKVKEAVYSTLTSLGLYETSGATTSCRHLDLFAGSGSVGLESLSRGATHCTFCDLAEDCCQTIQRNLDKCQFDHHDDDDNDDDDASTKPTTTSTVVRADVLDVLRHPAAYDLTEPYSLVTICPPYEEVIYGDLLEATVNSPLVTDDTVVVVEYPTELQTLPHVIISRPDAAMALPKKLIGVRNRKYGRTVIAIYICNPTGRLEGATSRPEEFVVPRK